MTAELKYIGDSNALAYNTYKGGTDFYQNLKRKIETVKPDERLQVPDILPLHPTVP